ncbi:MAG: helix-turn-helix domain-containing protein [Ardenticatenales bacterium]|nr:helix-turn-helix domain-containing protein [Ardenticatenales bacterium]
MSFGKILRSLRVEHFNDEMSPWSQRELADAADLPLSVIQNIEQGRRKYLDAEEIDSLGHALNLSAFERREFLSVANAPAKSPPRHAADSHATFDDLLSIVRAARTPAYLLDPFCNLVAINGAMIDYSGLSVARLRQLAAQSPNGANALRITFSEATLLRSGNRDRWERAARASIQQFRYTVLRYRGSPYFEQLLEQLHQFSEFRRLWRERRAQGRGLGTESLQIRFEHPAHGEINYATTFSTTFTDDGPLHLIVYIPLNDPTAQYFAQAASNATPTQRPTAWPDPALHWR